MFTKRQLKSYFILQVQHQTVQDILDRKLMARVDRELETKRVTQVDEVRG